MCWHAEHTFASTPATPGRVRGFAADALAHAFDGADAAPWDDVVLILSELVTNALRAGTDTVTASLELHRHALRIGVIDHAPGRPVAHPPSRHRTGGRGLLIVQTLSTRWGVLDVDNGKEVWAEVAVPDHRTARLACTV
jgi:anti-sigma regulatory factor (Ser/Thr protein kinase)